MRLPMAVGVPPEAQTVPWTASVLYMLMGFCMRCHCADLPVHLFFRCQHKECVRVNVRADKRPSKTTWVLGKCIADVWVNEVAVLYIHCIFSGKVCFLRFY